MINKDILHNYICFNVNHVVSFSFAARVGPPHQHKGLLIWYRLVRYPPKWGKICPGFIWEMFSRLPRWNLPGANWHPNKTLHFILATGLACSYGEFSSRLPMITLVKDDISASEQLAYSYERDFNFYSKTITRRDHRWTRYLPKLGEWLWFVLPDQLPQKIRL